MQIRPIPPWIIFVAVILLISNPRVFLVFVIIYILYRIFLSANKQSPQTKAAFTDFGDVINREFGDFFRKKREKTITIDPDRKKTNFSFSLPPMVPGQIWKLIGGVFLGLLLIFVLIDGFVNVNPGYVAVKFDRGRGVIQKPYEEGLHLKIPFWQEMTKFQTIKQEFTMAGDYTGIPDVDAVRGRSKDGQDVFADVTVTYQILPQDAPFLRKQFINEQRYKTNVIYPAARSVVYDAIGKFNALELISEKRDDFTKFIAENLKKSFENNSIQFREVFVRKITFSPEFANAIEEKQIAEQRIKTAQNRKLEAEELKLKTIIEAQAEAESIKLKGEALRLNPEVIQLQFVEKMAPQISWGILPDGALPLIDLKTLQSK